MTKKTIETPLLMLSAVAVLYDLLSQPFGLSSILLVMIISTLAFYYMVFSVLPDDEKITGRSIKKIFQRKERVKSFINVLGGWTLGNLVIAILAKLQLWERITRMIPVFLVIGIIVLVLCIFKRNKWLASRLILFLTLLGALYLIPNDTIGVYKQKKNNEQKKESYQNRIKDLNTKSH